MVDDLENLQRDKLRLEIEALRAPWWRSPTTVAPYATIVAATAGIIWAISSGFFDISRRELEVRKRELQAETRDIEQAKDKLTIEYQQQRAQLEAEIQALKSREQELRQSIATLDAPIIADGWMGGWTDKDRELVVGLEGRHFGVKHGALTLELRIACGDGAVATTPRSYPLPAKITAWSDEGVTFEFPDPDLRARFDRSRKALAEGGRWDVSDCQPAVWVIVNRADGKKSNLKQIVYFNRDY